MTKKQCIITTLFNTRCKNTATWGDVCTIHHLQHLEDRKRKRIKVDRSDNWLM
jgi:hypothetical protein